jgi:hypothetical protein
VEKIMEKRTEMANRIINDFSNLPLTREAHEYPILAIGEDRWATLATLVASYWKSVRRFHHGRDDRGAVENAQRIAGYIEKMMVI